MSYECVHHLFEEQVRKNPHHVALLYKEKELTYGELNSRANQLAHYLIEKKVKLEQPIGICIERSFELFIAILAVLKAGCAYVPLEPRNPIERILWMVKDANIQIVLTQSHLMDIFSRYQVEKVRLDADWDEIEPRSIENLGQIARGNNLIYIMYTSGSTGTPKGVCIEHHSLMDFINAQSKLCNITYNDRVLQFTSIAFDVSILEWTLALTQGAILCLVPTSRQKPIIDALVEILPLYQVTFVCFTPAMASNIPKDFLSSVKTLIVAGDICTEKIVSEWYESVNLINGYGPTEATILATAFFCDKKHPAATIGYALANSEIYILDEKMQQVLPEHIGEIYIGGSGLARGYLNRPDLTANHFVSNPFKKGMRLYKTGDLARYLSDGAICYIGRNDFQVKIRGYRVELNEISNLLISLNDIKDAVVLTGNENKSFLIAFLCVDKKSKNITREFIFEKMSEFLPNYMLPQDVVFLENFPLTISGKLDRVRLYEIYEENNPEEKIIGVTASLTAIESKLIQICSELTGCKEINVESNLTALGVDSIIALQMILRAQQQGFLLCAKDILDRKSIKELALTVNLIQEKKLKIQNVETRSEFPITPMQTWFFKQEFENLNHWNQCALLDIGSAPPHLVSMKKAVDFLHEWHGSLNLVFNKNSGFWMQSYKPAIKKSSVIQVTYVENENDMQQCVNLKQKKINIENGCLLMFSLFYRKDNCRYYISIIIHHLAIDGISWRVVLEDLSKLYYDFYKKKQPVIYHCNSYYQWSLNILDCLKQESIWKELDYWGLLITAINKKMLFKRSSSANTVKFERVMEFNFNKNETNFLLYEINAAYGTRINDILLAAFALIFENSMKENISFMLTRHGREPIIIGDLDFSHTIGWFTSLFPFLLDIRYENLSDLILSTKNQLATIPNNGVGYGILKYLATTDLRTQKLQVFDEPDILFNYLGQWTSSFSENKDWRFLGLHRTGSIDPKNKCCHNLEVNSVIMDGQLKTTWIYNEQVYSAEIIKKWGQSYLECLSKIIAHCLKKILDDVPEKIESAPNMKDVEITNKAHVRFLPGIK